MSSASNHPAGSFLAQFGTSNFVVTLQLSGLSNNDAVRRAREGEGSSISWIIGHLLAYRIYAVQACGEEMANPFHDLFGSTAPASDGTDYPDIAELLQHWAEVDERLTSAVSRLTAEQLSAEPAPPNAMQNETLFDALAFTAWHEAYHVGGIGMLRVQWGERHTHELAMEAMAAGAEGHP